MRIAVIADTHMRAGARPLPQSCLDEIARADLLLHAGDLTSEEAFEELAGIGPPLRAVHGNVDAPELCDRLPEQLSLRLEGVVVAMVHDAGPAKGRLERLRARFPDAAAVVFAHSHMPLHEQRDGFQIFNPGSPTQRRRAPTHTIGVAEVSGGRIKLRHVEVQPEPETAPTA